MQLKVTTSERTTSAAATNKKRKKEKKRAVGVVNHAGTPAQVKLDPR